MTVQFTTVIAMPARTEGQKMGRREERRRSTFVVWAVFYRLVSDWLKLSLRFYQCVSAG